MSRQVAGDREAHQCALSPHVRGATHGYGFFAKLQAATLREPGRRS
jgi:hypothetical protein